MPERLGFHDLEKEVFSKKKEVFTSNLTWISDEQAGTKP